MKVFSRFFNIVMESALWIFRGSSFHNLAAEVLPKRRYPNRMDIFIYGTSDVNAVDRKDLLAIWQVNVEHVTRVFRGTTKMDSQLQLF